LKVVVTKLNFEKLNLIKKARIGCQFGRDATRRVAPKKKRKRKLKEANRAYIKLSRKQLEQRAFLKRTRVGLTSLEAAERRRDFLPS
jgi:hypothetical protein